MKQSLNIIEQCLKIPYGIIKTNDNKIAHHQELK
jgi:NADH:ubiquinone oxidoreductase subunit D